MSLVLLVALVVAIIVWLVNQYVVERRPGSWKPIFNVVTIVGLIIWILIEVFAPEHLHLHG